ncbi:MAG TPA: hypothetical protein VJ144_02260 [Candidatus Polarisedimenticolia bacterium]|nr:hypothetical protein [Candidatus Polarisedimenticolia bacterium]
MDRPTPHAGAVIAALAALSLLAPLGAGARSHKETTPDGEKERPRLRLTSDRTVGFTPLDIVLTGRLTGVGPRDANFCHAAVTWTRIDPGQTEEEGSKVRENPACLHPKEQVSVPTSFTKEYMLYTPGAYLFRLMVEGKDGTRIVSGYAKVDVLQVR